jgi:DNA-binding phage protein
MTLAAAQVIDAVAARITGLALAGTKVHTSRAWPLAESGLPAWRVYAPDEDVEPQTVHPNMYQGHNLQVELHGLTKVTRDLDDALHALAEEALTALFDLTPPADALTSIASKLQISLRRIERNFSTEGEAAVGRVVLTLRINFRTRASAPGTLV